MEAGLPQFLKQWMQNATQDIRLMQCFAHFVLEHKAGISSGNILLQAPREA